MTWFKVDDSFWRSAKVRKLGEKDRLGAVGLWTLCGDWSADNLTDGFIPWEVVEQWDHDRRLAERIIAVGLWLETEHDGEVGVAFHDWEDYQPTKADVIATRASNARRAALHRDPELVTAIRERDRERCRYCGVLVNWKDRRSGAGGTYDHVDPAGRNDLSNLVVACRSCNSAKGERTPVEAGMRLLPPGTLPHGPGPNGGQNTPTTDPAQTQNGSSSRSSYIARTDHDPDPTRPDPTRISTSSSYVGGDRPESNARATATPPRRYRCKTHQHLDPTDPGPNCIGCRNVRVAAENAAAHQAADEHARRSAARATADACELCDDVGWRLADDGAPIEPAQRCDHRSLRVVS